MFKIFRQKRGAVSAIEGAIFIIMILAALLGFSGYIERAFSGRWKTSADSIGQGRQYDPRGFGSFGENGGSMDCFFDQETGRWVDERLYRENNCECTGLKFDGTPLPEYATNCLGCKASSACASPPS